MIQWHLSAIGVEAMHKLGHRGQGVKIAILDSRICDAGVSGKVVDWQCDAGEVTGHAEALCGVIRDTVWGKGIAPATELRSYPVLSEDARVAGYSPMIESAVADGCDIILISSGCYLTVEELSSMAFHEGPYADMQKALRLAQESGVLVVAAGGNQTGEVAYPACVYGVFDVGAVDRSLRKAGSSPVCSWAAPGRDITVFGGLAPPWHGTSIAAAIFAGSLALLVGAAKEKGMLDGKQREVGTEIRALLRSRFTKTTEAGLMIDFTGKRTSILL